MDKKTRMAKDFARELVKKSGSRSIREFAECFDIPQMRVYNFLNGELSEKLNKEIVGIFQRIEPGYRIEQSPSYLRKWSGVKRPKTKPIQFNLFGLRIQIKRKAA